MGKKLITENDFLREANELLKNHPKNNGKLKFMSAKMVGEHIVVHSTP